MNHHISEWQDLSLKKNIEGIEKSIGNKHWSDNLVGLNILFALFSLLLNGLISPCSKWYSIIRTSEIAIIAGLFILWISVSVFLSLQKKWRIKKQQLPIQESVDKFDNSICYYAMSARAFCDALNELNSNPSHSEQERTFYFIEANYYIDKCINEFVRLDTNFNRLYRNQKNEAVAQTCIYFPRLVNIIELLSLTRSELYKFEIDSESVSNIKELAKHYDSKMKLYIESINQNSDLPELHWDVKTSRLD